MIVGSRPPLSDLVEYLCSETLVPGKLERLGTGLSHGYHPRDMSGLETDGLEEEQIFFIIYWLINSNV